MESDDHAGLSTPYATGRWITAAVPQSGYGTLVSVCWRQNRMCQIIALVPARPSYNQGIHPQRFIESFKLLN